MLTQGSAKRVTVYLSEDAHVRGEPLYLSVLNYLFYHRVAGATVTKGVAGFGARHQMHAARILEMSEHLPVKIEFVETAEKLDALLPKLLQMVGDGLVEMQDTTVLKATATASDVPRTPLHGRAMLMRIFISEGDKWQGKKLYDALVESLRANDIAGVTVYRGIAGYSAHERLRRERPLSLSTDQPIMLSAIDDEAKIRAYLPFLQEMVQDGLVVLSDVQRAQVQPSARTTDRLDRGLVMTPGTPAKLLRVHFGEDDRWNGQPLHQAVIEEARRHGLAGATAYRGIEGYGASSRVHRKHLLTSSDLPVMVCLIDEASKIAEFLPTLERMVGDGLIAISDVSLIRPALKA